ncbi:MAG: molybdopterin-synthase adenylyltransferase MoeB [Gammaproteobacteria bacterium]
MNDDQLLRYSRQMMLPEIDARGQQRLQAARVLIIGTGGLGCAASQYLAAGGAGHITLVDFDDIDLSNLQRQILFTTADIGRPKVEVARARLLAINPEITIETLPEQLDDDALKQQVDNADLVLDCCDNFATRFAINAASVATKTPLVSAAAIRFEAQISVFDPRVADCPCYRCLYSDEAAVAETCTANGVIAPLLGIIGSMQAFEAMKLIMNIGDPLTGRLLLFDGLAMEWHSAQLPKDPDCPVCS